MNNKKSLDNLIKDAVKESQQNIQIPEMNDIWKKIIEHENQTIKKKRNYKKVLTIVASIIIVILISFNFTDKGYTSFIRNIRLFFIDQTGTLSLDNKVEDDYTSSTLNNERKKLQQLKKEANFPIKEIGYLPNGFKLEKVNISKANNIIARIKMIYSLNKETLVFIQVPISGQYAGVIEINKSEAKLVKEIIDNVTFNIIEYDYGKNEIIWDKNEVQYTLSGKLSIETMLKIAKSIN